MPSRPRSTRSSRATTPERRVEQPEQHQVDGGVGQADGGEADDGARHQAATPRGRGGHAITVTSARAAAGERRELAGRRSRVMTQRVRRAPAPACARACEQPARRPRLARVARYVDVHPDNPQPRLIEQVADAVREDALIAYPTDSGYALGTRLGNRDGRDRILAIRELDDKHHFTLMCSDFAQLGQFVQISNSAFRAIRVDDTRSLHVHPARPPTEVPRRLLHPKKRTVGVRIPDHAVCQALLSELGEPLLTSTLILPGETEPRAMGWEIKEELDHGRRPRGRGGRDAGRADHGRGLVGGLSRGRTPRRGRRRRGSRSSRGRARSARPRAGAATRVRQAHGVPDEEGDAVVGETGDDGLDDAVVARRRSPRCR